MKKQCKLYEYHSLKQLLSDCSFSNTDIETFSLGYGGALILKEIYARVFTDMISILATDSFLENQYITELWSSYLMPDYFDWYIWRYETNGKTMTADEILECNKKFLQKLMNSLRITKPKYEVILKAYNDEKNNLMNELSEITTDKYNDTPKNQGNFTGSDYMSAYREVERKSDRDYIIDKLDKISDKWYNVMKSWANEVGKIFMIGDCD